MDRFVVVQKLPRVGATFEMLRTEVFNDSVMLWRLPPIRRLEIGLRFHQECVEPGRRFCSGFCHFCLNASQLTGRDHVRSTDRLHPSIRGSRDTKGQNTKKAAKKRHAVTSSGLFRLFNTVQILFASEKNFIPNNRRRRINFFIQPVGRDDFEFGTVAKHQCRTLARRNINSIGNRDR
jgi:hypothetical protein